MAGDEKSSGGGKKPGQKTDAKDRLSFSQQELLRSTIRDRVAKRVERLHPELEFGSNKSEDRQSDQPGKYDPDFDETAAKMPGADKARRYCDILHQALIDADPVHHRKIIERLREEKIPIQTASMHLFTPVAARLGEMWCDDEMDFVQVAVASSRLNAIVNHLVRLKKEMLPKIKSGRRIILARTAGENHTLGLTIVAACFSDAGWSVDGGADMIADDEFMRQLKNEPYELMGISVGASVAAANCKTIITRGLQSSENRNLRTAVGGPAVAADEAAFHEIGADIVAKTAIEAVEKANMLFR